MIKPDLTKDIKPEDAKVSWAVTSHKDWCATMFTPYGDCDCEETK